MKPFVLLPAFTQTSSTDKKGLGNARSVSASASLPIPSAPILEEDIEYAIVDLSLVDEALRNMIDFNLPPLKYVMRSPSNMLLGLILYLKASGPIH